MRSPLCATFQLQANVDSTYRLSRGTYFIYGSAVVRDSLHSRDSPLKIFLRSLKIGKELVSSSRVRLGF